MFSGNRWPSGKPCPAATGRASPITDLRGLPDDTRQAAAQRLAAEELAVSFDLETRLPFRTKLLRLSDSDHILLWTVHHIAFDGWSAQLLRHELATNYGAFLRGEPSPLPELPVQYTQHAAQERKRMHGDRLERSLAFWRENLAGVPLTIALPADRFRPAQRTDRGGRLTASIDAPLVRALKDIGRRQGATLFMTMLAAFQALLARVTGTTDVVVGCPVAGRDDPSLENLIGPFINTIPLRGDLAGNPSFHTLVQRTQSRVLEALTHSDVPFEKLVEALRPERSPGLGPLFQVFLQIRNYPELAADFPGLEVSTFVVDPGVTPFDLSVDLWETPDGLGCSLDYSLDLFEMETASRLLDRFRNLLEAVAKNPDQPIDDVPLLTSVERNQVLRTWNATALELPFETCLHRLFEEQCKRTPEAIAVILPEVDADVRDRAGDLSYATLNSRANRLAHHLRSSGAGADVRVALFAERSLEMVIGLLGILKSGAAYVPIDPATPAARQKAIFDDAKPIAVVTQPQFAHIIADLHPNATIVALADPADVPPGPECNPEPINSPADLAYVIYTSGSTGVPKGVMNEHRAVCNMILWMQHALPIGPADRVAQKTPYTFDLSVWEFFWPLMAGARMVLARPGGHRDPSYLARLLKSAEVSICAFVPSTLGPFLDDPDAPPWPRRSGACSRSASR